MPISLDPTMMREIIMDHYEAPRNKSDRKPEGYLSAHMDSASCIDDITMNLKLDAEGRIQDICWNGVSCVISTAATSVATEMVKGMNLKQVQDLYKNFFDMLEGRPYDATDLGEALAFATTGRQPSRIGCATIGFRGILTCLEKEENKDA